MANKLELSELSWGGQKWQLSAVQLTITLEPLHSHVVSNRTTGVVSFVKKLLVQFPLRFMFPRAKFRKKILGGVLPLPRTKSRWGRDTTTLLTHLPYSVSFIATSVTEIYFTTKARTPFLHVGQKCHSLQQCRK